MALERYNLYFLDSVTIGNTQAMRAAQGTGVKVIKRKVFLDDTQNEADIRNQFNRAIALARRNGSAIAIGHPHPTTVRVLQQMVYNLPPDITLVRPSSLLNEPQVDNSPAGASVCKTSRHGTDYAASAAFVAQAAGRSLASSCRPAARSAGCSGAPA